MPYGWGNEQLSEKDKMFPQGQVEQGARSVCWAESRNAHKGKWCSHTEHTAATQQCRDQNSEPPLTLPGEIFLPSTAASLSFSMALITASCVRELLGISMARCSHCTWDFLLQWCLWRREQWTTRSQAQAQPASLATDLSAAAQQCKDSNPSDGNLNCYRLTQELWVRGTGLLRLQRDKPMQQEQAANTSPQ